MNHWWLKAGEYKRFHTSVTSETFLTVVEKLNEQ